MKKLLFILAFTIGVLVSAQKTSKYEIESTYKLDNGDLWVNAFEDGVRVILIYNSKGEKLWYYNFKTQVWIEYKYLN